MAPRILSVAGKRIAIFLVLLVAVLVGGAIAVVLPSRQDIIIFHRKEIEGQKDKFNNIIRDGVTLGREKVTLAREISKKFNSEASFLPLAQKSVTPNQLADFLKGNVEVSFKSEAFSGNLAIDPVLLVQAYIDKFFSRGAALVVVETFTPQPQAGGAEWYIMNVSLVARGSKLFDPALERSELIRQLSILRGTNS